MKKTKGFTLLELLIVIGILAILATIAILVLNPTELLRRSRDSARISDLSTIKTAIGLYLTDVQIPDLSTDTPDGDRCNNGTASSTFISIPTGAPTIGDCPATNLGTYGRVVTIAAASLTKTDGTGWIPVKISEVSTGSPLSNFPIDPSNTCSATAGQDLFYAYGCNQTNLTYITAARLESVYYRGTADFDGKDGGVSGDAYEVGTDLYTSGQAATVVIQ